MGKKKKILIVIGIVCVLLGIFLVFACREYTSDDIGLTLTFTSESLANMEVYDGIFGIAKENNKLEKSDVKAEPLVVTEKQKETFAKAFHGQLLGFYRGIYKYDIRITYGTEQ